MKTTPSKAQRSCVDEQSQHGVAHRKIRQDEKKREGVYTKYTKPEQCAQHKGDNMKTITKVTLLLTVILALTFASCPKEDDPGEGDLQKWTAVADSPFGTSGFAAIAYGNNRFVAVGDHGKIAYSADGVNWTAVSDSTI